jgi:hypothetical protein
MNLGDLFQRLSYGELSNLSMAERAPDGQILATEHDKLASYANHAIGQLYARFSYKRGYVSISLSDSRKDYRILEGDDALLPGETLIGEVVKILGVTRLDDPATTTVDETEVLGINQRDNACSVKVTGYDMIRVQEPVAGTVLEIEYRARPSRLALPADLSQEIDIAPVLEEALELNVAARVYSGMNGELNIMKARELLGRYEEACRIIEAEDLLSETETSDYDRLRAGGWI